MSSVSDSLERTLSPEEAFAILGNELRVEILRTLAAAERPESTPRDPTGLSFSELYDRVDVTNSSQFSYHLSQLEGAFVRQTDEGYRLTRAGQKVVRAILAGTYNERPAFEPVTLDGWCVDCDATTLEARYEDELLAVRCTDCGTRLLAYLLSPREAEDRTPMEVLRSVHRFVRDEFSMAIDGVCVECGGEMTSRVREARAPVSDEYVELAKCGGCGHELTAPIAARLTYHPEVISFCWARGLDVTDDPFWGLFDPNYGETWRTECLSTEPYAFRVVVALDGDELRVELDSDLEVASMEVVEDRLPGSARES